MFDLKVIQDRIGNVNLEALMLHITKENLDKPINEDNQTLLHFFSYIGNQLLVEFLLNLEVQTNKVDKYGNTALHYSALSGQVEAGRLLLAKKAKIDTVTDNGDTPLHYSCRLGHDNYTKFLLSNGAKVDIVNKDSLLPLHYSVAGNNADSVQLILDYGASIGEFEDKGYSVLHVASVVGNVEIAKAIIEYKDGKDLVNLQDEVLHWAPIQFANLAKNSAIVDLLKANGAIDSPPIFSFDTVRYITKAAKEFLCNPEKVEGLTIVSTSTATGLGLSALVKLRFADGAGYYAGVIAMNGLNYVVFTSLLKEWISSPLIESDLYISYRNTYCNNILLDKITDPKQVTSLKHAELYLGSQTNDYVALGKDCKTSYEIATAVFNDLGFAWTLCKSMDEEISSTKDEL